MPFASCTTPPDRFVNRRCEARYPVSAELEFRIIRSGTVTHSGKGVSVNLSTNGILFWTPEVLDIGHIIELRVMWPGCGPHRPIVLYILGQTVRVEGAYTAVEIWKQDFGLDRTTAAQVAFQ
jgi:hypothetical protein